MDADNEIRTVVRFYFEGVYNGNVALLATIFDEGAQVYGEVDGQSYHKTIGAYLEGVANRTSPKDNGDPYLMKLVSIDISGCIANVKLHSPMLGFNYHLYLSLVCNNERWKIVNKTFTNLAI
jgi:hypothetical protein